MGMIKLSKEHILEGIEDCNADLVYWQHQLESVQKHIETAKKNLAYYEEQLKLITDGKGNQTEILGQSESENKPSTGANIEGEIDRVEEQLSSSVSIEMEDKIPPYLEYLYGEIFKTTNALEFLNRKLEEQKVKYPERVKQFTYEEFVKQQSENP